jgi:hypothetical protein
MTTNNFFPECGLTLVFPWYLVHHLHHSCLVSLFTIYLQGFHYRLWDRAWVGDRDQKLRLSSSSPPSQETGLPEHLLQHQGLPFLHSSQRYNGED